MPQQVQLTPEQVQDLVGDFQTGTLTREQLQTRPDILQQIAPFLQGPPADRPGTEPMNPSTWANQGTFEAMFALPVSFAGMVPAAKPFTVPAAAALGGIGAGVDTVRSGRFAISDIMGGIARQGLMEAGGKMLAGPAARGMARGVMPTLSDAGADTALSARKIYDPRLVGRNAEAAGQKVADRGARVTESIEAIDRQHGNRPFIDRSELHAGAPAVRDKRVGRSMEEAETGRKFDVQLRKERGGAQKLTAAEVLEKKRGADEDYAALDRSLKAGKGTDAKKATKKLVGNNARRVLEDADEARLKPLMEQLRFGNLHQQNEKLGGAVNLKRAIETQAPGSRGGLLMRAGLGSLAGGAAGAAYDMTQGNDISSGSILNRYGPMGVSTGIAYGAAPFVSAKALRLLGQSVPSAARLQELLAELEREP